MRRVIWLMYAWGCLWAQDSLIDEKWNRVKELSQSEDIKNIASPGAVGIGSLVSQMFLGLFVVIVLIFIVLFLLKKLQYNKILPQSNYGFSILDQFGIGQNQKLLVVKVQGKALLLGVSQQNIQLIKELDLVDQQPSSKTFSKSIDLALNAFKKSDAS